MSRVKKITVSNLKAVGALTADFNGCTAIITGGNNKGKSSFLKSLPERIRGVKPEAIVKNGESEGFAEWELTTGEKFIWTFSDKKEKLTFISERNIPQSVTKDLGKAYFPSVFDIDEFLHSTPKKQQSILQKLSNVDFSEFDRAYQAAYEARTYANRRMAEEKAKLMYVDPKLPTKEVPVDTLQEELNGIDVHNMRYDTVISSIERRKDTINDNLCEIENLQNKIRLLEKENATLAEENNTDEQWIRVAANKKKDNAAELKEKINSIQQSNKLIAENNKAIEQQAIYDKAVATAQEADAEVKRIEADKAEAIRCSSLPDGFGFTEEGITYKGFDFNKDQLSSSAIYIAALKLAAMGLGEVKTLHFDASFLDKNSLSEIEAWAKENDLQLLIERPDFDCGEITYEIVSL